MAKEEGKFHWEIIIALVLNSVFLLAFFAIRKTPIQPVQNQPVELSIDISVYMPPKPKEMKDPEVNPAEKSGRNTTIEKLILNNTNDITMNIINEVNNVNENTINLPLKTISEYQQELISTAYRIQTYDGFNRLRTGLASGKLPPGQFTGASFQGRGNAQNRGNLLKKYGGSAKTEDAVQNALRYLASVQNPDGSWGSPDTLKSGDTVALSSLALLSFFSHGETFQSEQFGDNIRRGCDFMVEIANTPNVEFTGKGFGHAILTYALAEGYAITGSLSLLNALEQRVKFIIAHQNKFGSFFSNYDNSPQAPPGDDQQSNPLYREISVGEPGCDLSLLGWHIQALTAAKNSGLRVENLDRTLALALEALVKIHQADKGGFSLGINMKRFPPSANMTPVGLLGLYFLNAGRSNPADRAEKLLKKIKPPIWKSSGNFPLYRWYYQTQAMFQAERGRGKRWQEWNENLKKELLNAQQPDGSWSMPGGDNSYRVRNQNDLAVYASSLCCLMLQVYYRYLPGYSIAENSDSGKKADDFDLGGKGLISRLPEGADPMAAVILGVGEDDMPPIRFGEFNGLPDSHDAPLVEEEFKVLASLRSTIAVHKPEDWPQTLQSNQRIALFLDDLLPRTFKGHMSLRMAVIGSDNNASDYQQSVEVVLNGKRLLNSYLLRNKQLVDVVIPNDVMQPYGNILQIRNNGKVQLAFDAVELSAVNRVGKKLYLLTEKRSQLPEEMKKFFSSETSPEMKFCKISSHGENRQLLPELKEYDRDRLYIGEYSAIGNECMGNDFHKHYLRQTGREIVDWIAGGGSGMKINAILSGGRFYDSLYQTEYPAAVALKQTAKLFEGSPRRLNSQIYPKHGEKPALFLSCAASYNAPGIATVVIAKRFPIPEETEIIALIPWSGETEMVIERGFFSKQSPFRSFATPLETERKKITIKDNIFRLSGVFPELSVIRLYRSRAAKVTESSRRWHKPQSSSASASKINYSAVLKHLPPEVSKMKKYPVWQTGGFTSIFGKNVQCSVIPATEQKDKFKHFKLEEGKSLNITFKMNPGHIPGHESACLPFGNIPAKNIYALVFNIRAVAVKTKKRDHISWVTFRFGFCGKIYSTVIAMEEWQKIVLPLKGFNPSWKHLRILEPAGSFSDKIQSVSFEINDISVYAKD